MMIKTFPLLLAVVITAPVMASSLQAQSVPTVSIDAVKSDSLTPQPLVAKVPPFCKWTMMEALYSETNAPQTKTITVTQTGESLSEKVEENGKIQESYRVGPIEYTSSAGPDGGDFVKPGSLAIDDGSFPELSWVNQRFLLGIMNVKGQRCDVYADIHGKPIPKTGDPSQKLTELFKPESAPVKSKSKPLPGIVPPAFLADGVRVACLNAETHRPVLLQNGHEVRSYAFTLLPAQRQPLPKKIQELKAVVERTNRAVLAPCARP